MRNPKGISPLNTLGEMLSDVKAVKNSLFQNIKIPGWPTNVRYANVVLFVYRLLDIFIIELYLPLHVGGLSLKQE